MCCFWCFGVDIGAGFGVDVDIGAYFGVYIDIGADVSGVLEATWFFSSWVSWCFLDTFFSLILFTCQPLLTLPLDLLLVLVGGQWWLLLVKIPHEDSWFY